MSELGPGCVVQLRDVVDNVFDAAHDDLAARVCHVDHVVKRAENVLF